MPTTRRPKVRADAHPLVRLLADLGVSLNQVPPGPDGWHSHDSLIAGITRALYGRTPTAEELSKATAAFANALSHTPAEREAWLASGGPPPAQQDRPGQPAAPALPMMSPEDAFKTGRITARSRQAWEARYRADPQAVGQVLAGLAPVLDTSAPATPPVKTTKEKLAEIDAAIFGPSREQLHALEDEEELAAWDRIEAEEAARPARDAAFAASTAELQQLQERARAVDAERLGIAQGLTDNDYQALFPGET